MPALENLRLIAERLAQLTEASKPYISVIGSLQLIAERLAQLTAVGTPSAVWYAAQLAAQAPRKRRSCA